MTIFEDLTHSYDATPKFSIANPFHSSLHTFNLSFGNTISIVQIPDFSTISPLTVFSILLGTHKVVFLPSFSPGLGARVVNEITGSR